MNRLIIAALLVSGLAFAGQTFTGAAGGSQTFQVLVPNMSDGGASVGQAPCVCCEPTSQYPDGGNYCQSGTRIQGDGGCGPMDNQKSCALRNEGSATCFVCSNMTSTQICRDQRDGISLHGAGDFISFDFSNSAAAVFAGCPAGNQTDGGGFQVIISR